ncbi:unnamed protein product [Adineta steineri]|uniref:Uncharacterized protein n=2 Tax=Adineta steineri TaxID=433720 RepID=A0A815D4E9_9BILA|nr:unnamed protein product [Adineta steineri]
MIYFVFLLPPMTYNTAYAIALPWDGGSDYFWATQYLGYYTVLLTPFVCVLSLPEFREKCKALFLFRPRRTIIPLVTITNNRNDAQAWTLSAAPRQFNS